MKKIIGVTFILLLLLTKSVYSANLNGDLILYDLSGFPIIPAGFVPITGVVDLDNDVLVIDPFQFFGATAITNVLEILPPGSFTRTGSFGELLNATIPPDHVGAYIEIDWLGNVFNMFMGWQVNADKTVFTPIDVDGDGVPGMMMLAGPFAGINAVYDFTAEPIGPGVRLNLVVDGGNTQECSAIGGSEVTINAIPQLFGGASLDSIHWKIDGEDAGAGIIINPFLSLGVHAVEAIATTTTGETGSANVNVIIHDTTRPDLAITFLNSQGQVIDVAGLGPVEIRFTATDTCDPSPVVSHGNAVPAYGVSSGDVLHINASEGNLKLPTKALRVDAFATDASGNSISASNTLSIE